MPGNPLPRLFSCRGIPSCDFAAVFFALPTDSNDHDMLRETGLMQPEGPDGTEGLHGPQSMPARVERMLAQCRRQRGVMAVVCVHVARIEVPGEALSAALRRQVCEDLAHRMRTRVRGSDLVVQESEGDAGVLMAGAGDDAAQRVAQRFGQALSGTYRVGERLVQVTVRVGRAAFPEDGSVGADLVLRARERMGC